MFARSYDALNRRSGQKIHRSADVIDAVFGPARIGETGYASLPARSLRPGMLMLADRNFAAAAVLQDFAAAGADLLVRCKSPPL